jgi:hypothetical protein
MLWRFGRGVRRIRLLGAGRCEVPLQAGYQGFKRDTATRKVAQVFMHRDPRFEVERELPGKHPDQCVAALRYGYLADTYAGARPDQG